MNLQDLEGITALHWACSTGSLDVVQQLLINAGADPNLMEVDGGRLTPLDYAIIGGHQDVAQLLIENGALSISGIQDLAAIHIQRVVRGFLVRRKYAGILHKQQEGAGDLSSSSTAKPSEVGDSAALVTSTTATQDVAADSGHDRRRYNQHMQVLLLMIICFGICTLLLLWIGKHFSECVCTHSCECPSFSGMAAWL